MSATGYDTTCRVMYSTLYFETELLVLYLKSYNCGESLEEGNSANKNHELL